VIKKAKRIDLGKLFVSGRMGMLSEKVFILFKRKIIESIRNKSQNEILLFDLFDVNAIPKLTIAEEILELINEIGLKDGSHIFFNASEEFYTSLQQPLLSSSLPLPSTIVPFILTSGHWKWLGLPGGIVEDALNVLVRNKFISTDLLQELVGLSNSQVEHLRSIVDANPSQFTYNYKQDLLQCRFNINRMLGLIVQSEREIISKAFIDNGLVFSGHFSLPSGYHINKCVLTSHISRNSSLADRLFAQVARQVWASSPNVIIISSLFSFMLGERFRKELDQKVLNTFGYPIPRPRYGESINPNDKVFILTDIYSTGSSFNHIRRQVLTNKGIIVGAMSIVDAHGNGEKDDVQSSIELDLKLYSESKCPQCKRGEDLHFLDPFSCLPYKTTPRIKAPKGLLEAGSFWNLLREKNAILESKDSHPIYNGTHFTLFIETRKVLRDTAVSRELAAAALSAVGPNFDAILIPKNEGALLMAHAIQNYIQHHFGNTPEVIPCSKEHEKNVFIVPDLIGKSLKNSSLLIVDDGANTGSTLLGLHFAISAYKPKNLKYLVFLDRLFGTDRQNIQAILGSNYYCLFHLAIPAYREWDCPLCFDGESRTIYAQYEQDANLIHYSPSRSVASQKATKLTWEADH
jgi:orotate phosphoribosyltransferase